MDKHFRRLLITIYKWYHQMLMCFQRYESNACSKITLSFGGRGSLIDYIGLQGEGVVKGVQKKDYVIFEWSLILILNGG